MKFPLIYDKDKKQIILPLNRSKHLEGKKGFYDGKPITTKYVVLEENVDYGQDIPKR